MSCEEEGTEKQYLLGRKQGAKGKVTIAVIALSNLCAWCCVSLLAPFFPIEAESKGVSDTIIGFIYSCSELVIFIASPLFGKLLSNSSPRFFYIAGLCVFGCCDVLFGWLDKSPPGTTFIVICFAVRVVEALGTASIMTASYAIAGSNFPDRIGTVYGILEMVTGTGFLIGPAIGGGLYELGGFGLPFWVLGSCVFLCGCASCAVLPTQEINMKENTSPSSIKLFGSPLVWFGSASIMVSLFAFTIYGPVYAQHLVQFDLRQSLIGIIFIIPAGAFSATTPLWGWLLDKNFPPIPLISTGLICAAISMLFFGPAPFFTFLEPMLWLTIVSSTLVGFFLAPVVVSSMRCVVQGARDLGFKDGGSTFSLVGGVIQSSTCFGTFIGPMIGGAVTEKFGFGWTLTVGAAAMVLPVVCFSPYMASKLHNWFKERSQLKQKYSSIPLNGTYNEYGTKCDSFASSNH